MEEQEPVAGRMPSPSIHLGGAAFGCCQETHPRFSADNLTGMIDAPSVHDDDFEVTRLPDQVVQRLWKNLFLIERWNNDRNLAGPRPDEIATLSVPPICFFQAPVGRTFSARDTSPGGL